MKDQRSFLGKKGEELAFAYLQKLGYKVLIQNYRVRFGEIDIIARDSGVLAFIEVKTRIGSSFEWPLESVTPRKQRQLSKVALEFIGRFGFHDKPARFDVIAVLFGRSQRTLKNSAKIELIKNAFELCDGR